MYEWNNMKLKLKVVPLTNFPPRDTLKILTYHFLLYIQLKTEEKLGQTINSIYEMLFGVGNPI